MTNIEGIRERYEKATPGPWKVDRLGRYEDHDECRIELEDDSMAINDFVVEGSRYENADFIAHAREDIPFLLAEVGRLTAERDAAVSKLNAYCLYCGADFGTDEAGAIALREHIEQCPEHPMQAIKEGRDRWKARAEALERAARDFECADGIFSFACFCCIYRDETKPYQCGLIDNDVCRNLENWQLDEARFVGGREGATCD